jgi:putative DNA primase/helicase
MNVHHIPYSNGAAKRANGKSNGLHVIPELTTAVDDLPPLRAAPHNLEAEQALLGAILVDNDAHDRVADFLESRHFFDPLHGSIYEAFCMDRAAGKPVTPVTLRRHFENAAPIEHGLTVPQYLGRLAANATTTMNAKEYARIIVENAQRRLAIISAEDLLAAAHDLTVPLDISLRTSAADLGLISGELSADVAPVEFRRLSEIEAEPMVWLWENRFAEGKVGIIAGEPGVGKSQITCMMASIVSRGGKWPDGSQARKGSVIIICCEDDAADTLKPRLMAADADCSKIILCDWIKKDGKRHHFDVSQHIEQLSELVRKEGDVRLIVIDPISAYMGRTDSHVVAEVRQSLSPIQAMAAELGPAVLMVSHLNKGGNGGGNAISRVSGSGAYVAIARAAYLVVKDPEDETERRRIMSPLKNNLGDDRTGFSYRLEGWQSGDIASSRVVFDPEPVTTLADKLLQRSTGGAEDGSALAEACDFLRQELEGGPKPSKQVESSARDAGVSGAALKRARKELHVKARKDGEGRWHLELPDSKAQVGQGGQGGHE